MPRPLKARAIPLLEGVNTHFNPETVAQAALFDAENVDGFEIAIQVKGNGAGVTAADADYKPVKGIDALWQTAGMISVAMG